ncbi:MAG TPA: hypothetical protein VJZ26_10120 [Blastocatellia bacterium]|nr:hypothetical protein [Blastocatellia bacterium]
MSNHQWKLVGPWYRWQRPGVASAGRASRPVFQKYDGPGFVAEFMKDPQRSLKFTVQDFAHKVGPLPPLVPASYKGKPRRLSESGYFPTTTRKLFLDTHKRFYLVVCELHCEMPGLPSVNRDEVCEAGFVIRRRVIANLTRQSLAEAEPIFNRLQASKLAALKLAEEDPEGHLNLMKKVLAPQGELMLANAISESLEKSHALSIFQVEEERAKLKEWADKNKIALRLKGWEQIRDGIGEWADVEETPDQITEQTFRLYPLIPDPRDGKHSGKGRTIYFGTVPTGSGDTDEFGKARFDDVTQYEIRCFVRRHKAGCPKRSQKPDCHGELTWSAPTEVYQLASHFDLVGTSNRPVSMQLPDLKALEAQAAALPPNQLAPFRMVSPPDSNLEITANEKAETSNPHTSSQICSFSIPLITIVATFVFKLFLPVVTLLFGLFFLLKLKFCIPPSIELEAGIAAELNATLQLGLDVSVDAKLEIGTNIGNEVDAKLKLGFGPEMTAGLSGEFGPRAIATMTNDVYQSGKEQNAPSLIANLEYEAHVEAEFTS